MAEDYYNESSITPLSNVSIQFLIEIIPKPTCLLKPIINSTISTNTIVTVGTIFQFQVTIKSLCPGTSIIDYFRTPPLNMYKSNITFNGINNVSVVVETWTPTIDQIGSQSYCGLATDRYSIDLII
jgi:hypothetical protein